MEGFRCRASRVIGIFCSFFPLEGLTNPSPPICARVAPPARAPTMRSDRKPPRALPYQPRTGQLPESLRAPAPARVDASSRAYKTAASKYVRTMIALPILLVTSWVLFDRLALGSKTKTFQNRPDEGGSDGRLA